MASRNFDKAEKIRESVGNGRAGRQTEFVPIGVGHGTPVWLIKECSDGVVGVYTVAAQSFGGGYVKGKFNGFAEGYAIKGSLLAGCAVAVVFNPDGVGGWKAKTPANLGRQRFDAIGDAGSTIFLKLRGDDDDAIL